MLNITAQQNAAGAKSYFAQADYYSQGQEVTGRWYGAAAAMLGLSGTVEQADFHRLCDNLHPQTGEPLTAKAKGLTSFQILKDHAFRNAMLPLVTIIALNLGFTVAGAVQIETVFSWPGLGLTVFEAVERRDYPVLQGAFLLLAVCVILANFLADMLYTVLDPRVKV